MEPQVVKKPQLQFVGVETRYANAKTAAQEDHGFMGVWGKFMPNRPKVAQLAADSSHYAFPVEYPDGSLTYTVAILTKPLSPKAIPQGFVYSEVPAGEYAVFQVTPEEMGEAEQKKIEQWLKSHPEMKQDMGRHKIEHYPPECKGADDTMYSWLPVKRVR